MNLNMYMNMYMNDNPLPVLSAGLSPKSMHTAYFAARGICNNAYAGAECIQTEACHLLRNSFLFSGNVTMRK